MLLYTIGYSGYEREELAAELKRRGVKHLIDVRSVAASRFRPEYNAAPLKAYLERWGIRYRNMARGFGARQEDKRYLLPDGRVDFEAFARSEAFESGVEEIEKISGEGEMAALMCAEKDPAGCHRGILAARRFHEMGWDVIHITPEGDQTQREMEERLLDIYFPDRFQISMLEEQRPEEELIREAYRKQGLRIGFRKEE